MRYHALVTDYDGTLAHDGKVSAKTTGALERLRASGRRAILVTGREIDDLRATFDRLDLFDRVVAENGALLVDPATRAERVLCERPPDAFIAALRARNVSPLSVGRAIVATWEPNDRVVLDVIRELGLELEIIFNKGAVMVLPSGVNKASGLRAALHDLRLSPHNAVAVGDAQNDHAFLAICEAAVAVANALPMLKERADLVTQGERGDGVAQLAERLLDDDLASLAPKLGRHELEIGRTVDGAPVAVAPFGRNVLLGGPSGAGKSSLTTTVLEGLVEHGYQFCLIDPEGDHGSFPGGVTLGESERPPTADEALAVLDDPGKNLIVDLIGLPLAERPEFFDRLLPRLHEMRTRNGHPHWILIDEAHHLLPASWQPAPEPFPREHGGTLLVVLDPSRMSRVALDVIDDVIAVGGEPWDTFGEFARAAGGREEPKRPDMSGGAQATIWHLDRQADDHGAVELFVVREPSAERERHRRKYAAGELPPDRSFYFRGPDGKLNLRAQNLQLFVQLADGVDDGTWLHHLRRGDYSRWVREKIKDDDLATALTRVEEDAGSHELTQAEQSRAEQSRAEQSRDRPIARTRPASVAPPEAESPADLARRTRTAVREAIEERYTAPA